MHLSRLHITVFLAIAVIVWVVSLMISGIPIGWKHFTPFGITVSALAVIGSLSEYVLWKKEALFFLFRKPNLIGTWKTTLQSNYIDPKTKRQIDPIDCFVSVTQRFSKIQFRLMTEESQSWFVSADFIESNKDDGFELFGIYTNEPRIDLRQNRSEIHYGALKLELHGSVKYPASLRGEYWTDRSTQGSLHLTNRIEAQLTSFEEANAAFANGNVGSKKK